MIRAGWRGFIAFLAMLAVLVVVGGAGAEAAVGGAFAAGRATLDTTSAEAADAADHPGIVNVSTGWRPDTAADGHAPDVGGYATLAQRVFVAADSGFDIVGGGVRTRAIDYTPNAADSNWGLTRAHLDKHMFGSGKYSRSQIDPGGNSDI